MARRRIDRQIDDTLLAVATGAGVLYARRRLRRLARGAVLLGVGAAGIGALGLAGATAAWYRARAGDS